MSQIRENRGSGASAKIEELDAVVVGAGFAGLYMLHRLRALGRSARVFERGSGVGGTWFWNRYPGARCDVESLEYSYQFSEELQQEWRWRERYAGQPEILEYINAAAERFDWLRDVQLNTQVESAHFDEGEGRWLVRTSAGDRISAQYCIMATGCLSSTNTPKFEGLDTFSGACFHTGSWPPEGVDFRDKRVGVIGTGSSAIQSIPIIAAEAEQLVVFQRTPNYSVPAHNGPLDPELEARIKADYSAFRERNKQMVSGFGSDFPGRDQPALEATAEERERVFQERWARGGLPFMGSFNDLLLCGEANDTAGEFIRRKIREKVRDPLVAEALSPKHVVGCKRLCVDTDYFETFNRSNVRLVDLSRTPIDEICERGIRVGESVFELDCLVLATGFDAMTGALARIDIRGREQQTLNAKWAEGPRSYLGLATVGFPNLFIITGPGSPSVLTNMLPSIEQHVEWIADCVAYMHGHNLRCIEPCGESEEQWVSEVNETAAQTLFPSCNSWYLGANVPGKPRVFMPYLGFPAYVQKCEEVVAKGYDGFVLSE